VLSSPKDVWRDRLRGRRRLAPSGSAQQAFPEDQSAPRGYQSTSQRTGMRTSRTGCGFSSLFAAAAVECILILLHLQGATAPLQHCARTYQQDVSGFCDQARNRAHASFINTARRIARLSSIESRSAVFFETAEFGSTVGPAPGDRIKHWSAATLPWRYRASASTTWRWLSWERVSDICADIIRIAAQLVQFA
jgi:hypothetical protein